MLLSVAWTAFLMPRRSPSVTCRGGFNPGGGFLLLPLTIDDETKIRKIADVCVPDLLMNSGVRLGVYQTISKRFPPRHVSLSKTFYIDDNHQKKLLLQRLKNELTPVFLSKLRVTVDSNHLKIMHNEMKTRSYVVLTITDQYPAGMLNEMIQTTNEVLRAFDAPSYYNEPEFHVSLGYVPYNEHLQIMLPTNHTPDTVVSANLTLQSVIYYDNEKLRRYVVVDVAN